MTFWGFYPSFWGKARGVRCHLKIELGKRPTGPSPHTRPQNKPVHQLHSQILALHYLENAKAASSPFFPPLSPSTQILRSFSLFYHTYVHVQHIFPKTKNSKKCHSESKGIPLGFPFGPVKSAPSCKCCACLDNTWPTDRAHYTSDCHQYLNNSFAKRHA